MLHYLDDLDSKMEAMRAQFERGGESEGPWTGYNPSLGRPLLNTEKFLREKPSKEPAEAVSPAPGSGSDTAAAADGSLAALVPGEKENTGTAMTSAAHEDKI